MFNSEQRNAFYTIVYGAGAHVVGIGWWFSQFYATTPAGLTVLLWCERLYYIGAIALTVGILFNHYQNNVLNLALIATSVGISAAAFVVHMVWHELTPVVFMFLLTCRLLPVWAFALATLRNFEGKLYLTVLISTVGSLIGWVLAAFVVRAPFHNMAALWYLPLFAIFIAYVKIERFSRES